MALEDLKIKEYGSLIANLPDTPSTGGFDAKRLKDYFDGNDKETKEAINNVIDFLINLTGNEEIKGFKVEGNKFFYTTDGETYIETGYTKAEVDNLLTSKANEADVLTKTNANVYTPTGDYQPATKKYVDDKVVSAGAADMMQAIYDPTGRQTDIFAEIDKKLPLAGGTLTGPLRTYAKGSMAGLIVYRDDTGHPGMEFRNSNDRLGYIGMNASSKHPFYLPTEGGMYYLYGEHNKDLIAESFLSLAGGVLGGKLGFANGKTLVEGGSTGISIIANSVEDISNVATSRMLRLMCSNTFTKCMFIRNATDGSYVDYVVFGEHNKPTGTYTGNGSTSARTISVNGLGSVLLVTNGARVFHVTADGFRDFDANTSYSDAGTTFNGTRLVVSGSNKLLNISGTIYKYFVL